MMLLLSQILHSYATHHYMFSTFIMIYLISSLFCFICYFSNMNIFYGIYILLLCISLLLINCSRYFDNQLHTSSFIHLYMLFFFTICDYVYLSLRYYLSNKLYVIFCSFLFIFNIECINNIFGYSIICYSL